MNERHDTKKEAVQTHRDRLVLQQAERMNLVISGATARDLIERVLQPLPLTRRLFHRERLRHGFAGLSKPGIGRGIKVRERFEVMLPTMPRGPCRMRARRRLKRGGPARGPAHVARAIPDTERRPSLDDLQPGYQTNGRNGRQRIISSVSRASRHRVQSNVAHTYGLGSSNGVTSSRTRACPILAWYFNRASVLQKLVLRHSQASDNCKACAIEVMSHDAQIATGSNYLPIRPLTG